jgi:glutathione reductase (NADPH)
MFRLAEQPRRFLVMGGGYIAIEFACVMRGLGSEVTLVHRSPHLLRGFDDDARAFVTREVQKKGIRVITNATVDALEKRSTGLVATLSNGDTIEVDGALSAIGRLPKTASLGLDNAGVRVDDVGAIVVDDYGHTNVPSVHAIGDVTNRLNLTPVAIAEGTALARTLFNGTKTAAHREDVPTAVFSSPPLSCVGLTEARAREFGPVDIYTSEFRPMKHTMSGSDERSFMKLVVDQATQRVLGAHMVGADAPEIIQGIAIAITCRATKAQFDATIGIHPTAAEEFVTMRDKR